VSQREKLARMNVEQAAGVRRALYTSYIPELDRRAPSMGSPHKLDRATPRRPSTVEWMQTRVQKGVGHIQYPASDAEFWQSRAP
jgi:hypothetical protein